MKSFSQFITEARVSVTLDMGDPGRLKSKEEANAISSLAEKAKKAGSSGGVQTTTKKGKTVVTVTFKDVAAAKKFADANNGTISK